MIYWICIVIMALLLINKSTRKIALKILLFLLIMVVAMLIIFLIGMLFFRNNVMLFSTLSLFTAILAFMLGYSIKYLIEIINLYKFGCRTTGEIIDNVYRRKCKIRYHVNNEEYLCIGERLTGRWKIGGSVTVIYSQQEPQNSCIEKEDLNAAIIMTITSFFLLTGAIIIECYALIAV